MTVSTIPAPVAEPVVTVESDPLEALRSRLTGQLLTPGPAAYDEARRTIYVHVDRHPALIVRAATSEDVAAAVDYARTQ